MYLEATRLSKSFTQGNKRICVLDHVNIRCTRGMSYAITGCSGAGKSTLIHILAGIEYPDEGTVFLDGRQVSLLSENERAQFLNRSIGLVFQNSYLVRELSVVENVMVKGLIAGLSYDACRTKALQLLERVGIAQAAYCPPFLLSGGQQQRVALARALFNEPLFLLADEPTGNLDVHTGMEIVNLLLECQKQWHMGIIISSHDEYVYNQMQVVYRLSDSILTSQ